MAFIIVAIVIVLGGALVFLLATGRRRATTGPAEPRDPPRDEGSSGGRRRGRDHRRHRGGPGPGRRVARRPRGRRARDPPVVGRRPLRADRPRGARCHPPTVLQPGRAHRAGARGRRLRRRRARVLVAVGCRRLRWQGQRRQHRRRRGVHREEGALLQRRGQGVHPALPRGGPEEGAQAVYGESPSVLAGMEEGFVALYQKCPHLGCRVPWCQTSQWFECPCHGSKYNRVGEKKGGPAPRGMDRFGARGLRHRRSSSTPRWWSRVRRSGPTPPARARRARRASDPADPPLVRAAQERHLVSFRTALIVLTLVVFGLMAVYLVWRLVSVRRNPTTREPENLAPFLDDEGLEGPRLERALGWSLIFVMIVALALPVVLHVRARPPGRPRRDVRRAGRRAGRDAATPTASRRRTTPPSRCCARTATASTASGGQAPFVLQPELDICDDRGEQGQRRGARSASRSQVSWSAPALDTVLLRFPEEEVFQILTWGRPGTADAGVGRRERQGRAQHPEHRRPDRLPREHPDHQGRGPAAQHQGGDRLPQGRGRRTSSSRRSASSRRGPTSPRLEADPESTAEAIAEAEDEVASAEADRGRRRRRGPTRSPTWVRARCCSASTAPAATPRARRTTTPTTSRCRRRRSRAAAPSVPTSPAAPRSCSSRVSPARRSSSTGSPLGAPANEGYGIRGISSGRMPYFVNMLSEKQIKAIVAYERSL